MKCFYILYGDKDITSDKDLVMLSVAGYLACSKNGTWKNPSLSSA